MSFDPKLEHGTCAIRRIPFSFTQCKSILDQPLTPSVPPNQQSRYQPVYYCKYWHVLGSFKKFNTI